MSEENTANENTESTEDKKQSGAVYSSSIGGPWTQGSGESQTTGGSESVQTVDNTRRKTT